ncbi:MAG: recombination protein RecR [Deltaproteobacteria bacterium]|nr:recombination protein RecR [Deltaproteobacteria bacterium]
MNLQNSCENTPLERLVSCLTRLPGIGRKTAQRLAFHMLRAPKAHARQLAESIVEVIDQVVECSECHSLSFTPTCAICSDPSRNREILCVVEDVPDLMAIEGAKQFKGMYHVLHGVISPAEGIGPEQLRIDSLLLRIKKYSVKEVILALNPTVEGETTALYLADHLRESAVRATRLAYGIPVGGDLEYIDMMTIGRAMENRVNL